MYVKCRYSSNDFIAEKFCSNIKLVSAAQCMDVKLSAFWMKATVKLWCGLCFLRSLIINIKFHSCRISKRTVLIDSLRDPSLSIDSFRRQLKTFLFDN